MTASRKLIQSAAGNVGIPRPAKFLYVSAYDDNTSSEALFVFDVSTPSSISEVERFDITASERAEIVVDDDNDKLYVSVGNDYLTYDINPSTGALTNESTRTAGFPFDGAARIGNGNLVIGTDSGQTGSLRIFDPANNSVIDSILNSSNLARPNTIRMDKMRNEAIVHARQEEASSDTPGVLYKFDVSNDTLTQLERNEYGQDGANTEKNLAHWNDEQIALLFDSQDNQFRSFDTSSSGLPLLASGSGIGGQDFVAFFSAGRFYSINEGASPSRVDISTIASDGTIGTTGSYTLINNLSSIIIDTFSEVVYVVGARNPAHVFALDVSQSTITATEELDDLSVTNGNFNITQVGLYFGPNTLNPE